jgi:hypothetical protein
VKIRSLDNYIVHATFLNTVVATRHVLIDSRLIQLQAYPTSIDRLSSELRKEEGYRLSSPRLSLLAFRYVPGVLLASINEKTSLASVGILASLSYFQEDAVQVPF